MAKAVTRKPKARAKPKPKLTDAERHKRFVDVARDIEASTDANDFDEAFEKVTPRSDGVIANNGSRRR
ncbi:hypothetical protein [Methylocystis sp. B8]|uniref:hypothetical protein n=1 Tax=Methylocystis sp. B8 TaxID=544938 RepID=UPI0010FD3D6F|nr:hypothetical protein [Methylocystis sp. B8]TLG77811.1 hypothetical protein FEV16_08300 [Methylocystis sp. B8]